MIYLRAVARWMHGLLLSKPKVVLTGLTKSRICVVLVESFHYWALTLAGAGKEVSRLAVDEEGIGDVGRRAGDHGLPEHGDGVPPPPLRCTN